MQSCVVQQCAAAWPSACLTCVACTCRYDSDPGYSLELFLDIHGHSASRSGFLFCNPPLDPCPAALDRINRYTHSFVCVLNLLFCLFEAGSLG